MVWKDDLLWGNQSKTQAMMWVAKDKKIEWFGKMMWQRTKVGWTEFEK